MSPTFRQQMPALADSEPDPALHGGMTEMTTVRFEQDHGVGTIVLANPPSNRIGSQFAVDLRAAVHDASLSRVTLRSKSRSAWVMDRSL
jgi:hypothetical protein